MSAAPADRTGAFISYSHQDRADLEDLLKHLTYFERNGLIDLWVDTKIAPGQRWFDEIQQGLTTARAAIFLVSANFLASEFIQREELPALLKAAEQEHVTILVVVLDACDFASSPLAPYQAIHDPKTPLNTLSASERAKVWTRVAGQVRKALPPTREARPRDYLPYSPTPHFHERPGEFETLESVLFQRAEPVRLGLVGVVGMGGVGKTALAVELAYRDQDLFPDGMFWMLATGTLFDWQQRLAELAERTNYLPPDDAPGQSENELRRARHFATYLATHSGALLILDNVEQPTLVITAWSTLIGRQPACTLLYTSRLPTKPDGSVSLHRVETLSEEAALHLLLEDLRPAVLQQALADEPGAEARAARTLCQGVGYLPLGLVHLRRQLENDPLLSLAGLEQGVRELGHLAIASADAPDAPSLFATFAYSWNRVEDIRARQLFYLAGFFPEAAPIPLWLLGLAAGLGERGDAWGPLREARLTLQDQSLLEPLSEGQVRLHPLLREFAQRLVPAWRDQSQGLRQQAGERLVTELTNLPRLAQRARGEGYWGCLEQMRAAASYAARLSADRDGRLALLARWLDREGHLLGQSDLWPERVPGLFFQQLANRTVEAGQPLAPGTSPEPWLRQLAPVEAEDPALVRIFAGHLWWVSSVAFSPDGRQVLTGSDDFMAGLWEASSGKQLRIFAGLQSLINSVAFSPDGGQVLTGSVDGMVRLWEASSGKPLCTLEGHQSGVNRVAFSPDGRLLVTGDGSGRVYCWANNGAQTGQVLALYPAAYRVLALHWQDNHHLLLADDGGPRRKPNVYRLQLEGM